MPKQNKVRKGTHSCWECRRRKVKCVFATPTDARCIICQRRDSTCTSQSADSPFNTPQNKGYAANSHGQIGRDTDDDRDVRQLTPTLVLPSSTEVGERCSFQYMLVARMHYEFEPNSGYWKLSLRRSKAESTGFSFFPFFYIRRGFAIDIY